MTLDWDAKKRDAALELLRWDNTAVIEGAATLLVLDASTESMMFLCEALALGNASDDWEADESILWLLRDAWTSGEVDVPSLLRDVRAGGCDDARSGATIALEWLHSDK